MMIQGQEGREWLVGEKIDSGGFGCVYLVKSGDLGPHVAKFIPKAPGADRELLFPELIGLEYIVPVVDSGECDDYWVIVMPKADKSLADYLRSNTSGSPLISTARDILEDIASALVSMKGRVVHRDIKPANILLLNGHWCLADFGISRYAEATTADDTRKHAWTPPYAAPEQWQHKRATNATDVYAFGVVAYRLYAGKLPFSGPDLQDYRQQHIKELPELITGIPPAIAQLVNSCLMKAPEVRPSPETILSRLRQPPKPQSAAEDHLRDADARVVRRRQEQDWKRSVEQSEQQRKEELYQAAKQSFRGIITLIAQRIRDSAQTSNVSENESSGWKFTLGNATLSVPPVSKANRIVTWNGEQREEIMAFSEIVLRTPRDLYGYKGRSCSLWYFRRKQNDDDGFRWYELEFTYHGNSRQRSIINPFSVHPEDKEVEFALRRGAVGMINVVDSPLPIDQGSEEDFVDRWICRFAKAV